MASNTPSSGRMAALGSSSQFSKNKNGSMQKCDGCGDRPEEKNCYRIKIPEGMNKETFERLLLAKEEGGKSLLDILHNSGASRFQFIQDPGAAGPLNFDELSCTIEFPDGIPSDFNPSAYNNGFLTQTNTFLGSEGFNTHGTFQWLPQSGNTVPQIGDIYSIDAGFGMYYPDSVPFTQHWQVPASMLHIPRTAEALYQGVESVQNLESLSWLWNPENGSVMLTELEPSRWRFSIIYDKFWRNGEHPLYGAREFGWTTLASSATFYTRGISRMASDFGVWLDSNFLKTRENMWPFLRDGMCKKVLEKYPNAKLIINPNKFEEIDWPPDKVKCSEAPPEGSVNISIPSDSDP